MAKKYSHLLSPIKVGDLVLRNRMVCSPCTPHFIQGPESYPAQAMIELMAARARAGAAVVTFNCAFPKIRIGEFAHAPKFEYVEPRALNYFSHLTEAVHFEGGAISFILDPTDEPGWDVSEGIMPMVPDGTGITPAPGKEMSKEMILEHIEEMAQQALILKQCGFDMVTIHSSYRFFLPSRFLSPLTNFRTDEFGGSMENRLRFLKMTCQRIKELCGPGFPVEITISGEEPEGGFTAQDVIEWSKMLDGCAEILQIRAGEIDPTHPTSFCLEKAPNLKTAEIIKKGNPNMLITTSGGLYDFDLCESAIAEGKTDMVASARAWISNSNYGNLAYEGRPEDRVPCLRCNKCHVPSPGCTYNNVCSVNPEWGSITPRLAAAVKAPEGVKKIAVIGGGPAGMEAAQIAANRGHQVTLFEKQDHLGGLLQHAEYADFKWTLRDFNHYMIRKTTEAENIEVKLNTEATPEMLEGQGYDHVIVAIGAKEAAPPIPGIEEVNFLFASDLFVENRIDELAEDVVVIGGGEIGTETALWIAQSGRSAFVIEMQEKLCADAAPVHYRSMVEDYWLAQDHFSFAVNATCTKVSKDGVYYTDEDGNECFAEAGSIVLATGAKAQTDKALEYYGKGTYTSVIGDCVKAASVQQAIRTGYAAGRKL